MITSFCLPDEKKNRMLASSQVFACLALVGIVDGCLVISFSREGFI